VRIGRLQQGRTTAFPAGDYLYVGSALGPGGALSLPRRLIRHATRSAAKPAHRLRSVLLDHFAAAGLDAAQLPLKAPKRLHWNIVQLLDDTGVALVQVVYIRCTLRLEHALVDHLEHDTDASMIIAVFGAHDHPGHSHLFSNPACESWHAGWIRT